MTDRDRGAPLAGALSLALFVLCFLLRARGADDWDGLGFLASMRHFDLAAFSPHPPGYPVYVALLRVAGAIATNDTTAATGLSAACGAIGAFCMYVALRARAAPFVACAGAAAACSASLVFRAESSIGTEGVAVALALAAWALTKRPTRDSSARHAFVAGALAGLGLGVRVSWWALFLAVPLAFERGRRARGVAGLGVGIALWLAPLAAIVGPSELVRLTRVQAEGHATRWGHTALSATGSSPRARAAFFARDVAIDGLGLDTDVTSFALAAVFVVGLGLFVRDWAERRASPPAALIASLALYAVFVLFFQNVETSPRHVVPIVLALAAAAALGFAQREGPLRYAAIALVALLAIRATSEARARLDAPPLGAQVVAIARASPPGARTAVFGGDTARFAALAGLPSGYAETVADVDLALGAMSSLPTRVLVTGEVDAKGSNVPLVPVARVCRPPRADRKHACLDVFEAKFPYLPRAP